MEKLTNNKSKILIVVMILALSIFLTACNDNGGNDIATADGEIIEYTRAEAEEKGGFFIKKDEDTYQQLLSEGVSTTPVTSAWFSGLEHLIPEINSGSDSLVYISYENRPEMYEFTEMKDMGPTLGVGFKEIQNAYEENSREKSFTFDLEMTNTTSPAGEYIKEILKGSADNVKISEINDMQFKDSMLTSDGFIRGLTEDAVYKIWFYEGTVYKSVNLLADSRLFLENMTYYSRTHREEKDIYFTVGIPQEMPPGYYLIDNQFMFKYNPPKGGKGNNKKDVKTNNKTR